MRSLFGLMGVFALTAMAALAQGDSAAPRDPVARAKQLTTALKGLKGPERMAALERTAHAWARAAAAAGSEAAAAPHRYQEAEMWRRAKSLGKAETAYLAAAGGDPARFSERGLCGAADMERRQGKTEVALANYRKVAATDSRTNRSQEARIRVARALDSLGKRDEALAAYHLALQLAERPRQAILAANWLAKAQVVRGDLEGAEKTLTAAGRAVADAAGDQEEDVRLQKLLDSMSARRALQRAKDKANDSAGDARRLEDRKKKRDGGP